MFVTSKSYTSKKLWVIHKRKKKPPVDVIENRFYFLLADADIFMASFNLKEQLKIPGQRFFVAGL